MHQRYDYYEKDSRLTQKSSFFQWDHHTIHNLAALKVTHSVFIIKFDACRVRHGVI